MKALLRHWLVLVVAAWTLSVSAGPLQFYNNDTHSLSLNAFDGELRLNLSGLLDLEFYDLPYPPPGLIYSDERYLFNPRLSLFLDGQVGSKVYFFVQGRLDRGFDPSDQGARARLDEYAVRFTPWDDGRLSIQVGKFGTVVGNWVQRHLSWDNPFINAPLPYENLTGIWSRDVPENAGELLAWGHVPTKETPTFGDGYSDKYQRAPVIWGPSYATGASVAGKLGDFEYAAEVKNSSLSSPPEAWDVTSVGFQNPTWSGRIGYRPNMAWNFGLSASTGCYLEPEAKVDIPRGVSLGDYQERVLGQDISFEWHHLQIWSEVYAARFEVPTIGHADTLAYYIEAKYKFTPQFFGALRWNQQFFGDINDDGVNMPWGTDTSQVDAAVGYRFTPNMQLKLQYSVQSQRMTDPEYEHTISAQLTFNF